MYKTKGIRDKKGKLVGGAYMMNNRAGDQAITAETGAFFLAFARRLSHVCFAFRVVSVSCRGDVVSWRCLVLS